MAWLLRDGEVLASVEIPSSFAGRARAMSGRRPGECGAILLDLPWFAHSLGAGFPLDVAYLDAGRTVVATTSMGRNRVGLPHLRARSVLEVEAGAFERWGLRTGDRLEIKE